MVALARGIGGGVAEIGRNASSGIAQIGRWLGGPPLNLAQSQLDDGLRALTQRLQQSVDAIASGVLTGVGAIASSVITGLLALVLAFLFVKDGPRFLPWLRSLAGPAGGGHLSEVLLRVWRTLAGYMYTQAIVAFIDGALIGIGLLIVGVPLALPLAVLTFIGGFIPIVGALVAGAIAVLVALVSNGFTAALIVLGIIVAVQQIEGNVLQPVLQARSLNLHAAVVLLAVTAGSSLYGIAGAFLSVPVVAAAAVVLRYLGETIDARTGVPSPPPQGEAGAPVGDPEAEDAAEEAAGSPTTGAVGQDR